MPAPACRLSFEVVNLSDRNLILRWELITLAQRRILDDDEAIYRLEEVRVSGRTGALVVTDRRVAFVRTSPFRRRVSVESVLLSEIESVKAFEDPVWVKRWGSIEIRTGGGSGGKSLRLDGIRGGRERAQEIAHTIIRLRDGDLESEQELVEPGSNAHSASNAISKDIPPHVRVALGRGVAEYVRSHGGCLYVWGQPLGKLQWMKADTKAPDAIEFVHLAEISDFELYVAEETLSAPSLRLVRRWWLPGGGIAVDTGVVLGG